MTEQKKTEVNLEICSGFFRIPTESVIYNITVLPSEVPSTTTQVVEKIIEVEKVVEVEKKAPSPAPSAPLPAAVPAPAADDYFERCARHLQDELAQVAQGATGPDLVAMRDLGAMAGELHDVLRTLKGTGQPAGTAAPGAGASLSPALEALKAKIDQAVALGTTATASEAPPLAATSPVTRYLFNLDAIFQTIYELCTNETVKSHIQSARARAGEIFERDGFIDAISPKVGDYPEDDGFLTVPMADIYSALAAVCSDKAIRNLLAKMDQQKASIFLDQYLPLEVPPKEEVAVAAEPQATAAAGPDPTVTARLLADCQTAIDTLIDQAASQAAQTPSEAPDQDDRLDEAMTITLSIQHEARQLAAAGEARPQDRRLAGLATLARTLLERKATEPALSFEAALAAAQALAAEEQPSLPPPAPPAPPAKPAADNFGEASQDDIDRLLEELA